MKFTHIIFIAALLVSQTVTAEGEEWILSLEGKWKFSVGDKEEWKEPGFNDAGWEEIKAPATWENEGFHGYNGFAWYRKEFRVPAKYKGRVLYLAMGRIDDADEVYINGRLVGFSGSMPPDFESAYNVFREYPVMPGILNFDRPNVIAVRVYDSELSGGILGGSLGLFYRGDLLDMAKDFAGFWKFKTGDDEEYKDPGYNDADWARIIAPAYWEMQGYKDYDGYAWYRLHFNGEDISKGRKYVVMLGKIDDVDEVYLNGKYIGSTGDINGPSINNTDYQQIRGYYVDGSIFDSGGDNVIAVRVFDGFKEGGIYSGPIGIVEQDEYIKYWREKKKKRSIWDIIFN